MKKYLSGLFVMLSVLLLLVSTAFASTDYTITDVKLTDLKGNSIEYAGGSCMVNVSVTKNTDTADGYVVISSYTEDETLIGFNYLFTSLDAGESATLGAMVSLPDTEKIGKVKAMVWDSLDGMTPLAASKTLIPGEEAEPTPTPTPEEVKITVDGTLVNDQFGSFSGVAVTGENMFDPDGTPSTGDEYTITDAVLRIKNSATSSASRATEYRLRNAVLYVNGEIFCNVNGSTVDAVQSMLKKSTGMTILVQDKDIDGVYNKIYLDYYVVASLSQITETASQTQLSLTGITAMPNPYAVMPGSSLIVYNSDIQDGYVTVNVTRNGEKCTLSDIQSGDVLALKYNIRYSFNNFGTSFDKIDIIATSDTLTGKYIAYDPDYQLYNISGVEYSASKSQTLTLGNTYTFRLDPFGRLFDIEEEMTSINYAIVERYVDMSLVSNSAFDSDYDFIDVVTLDGESKRLFIDASASMSARAVMTSAGITENKRMVAASVPIENRIIEYRVKTTTGRLNDVCLTTNAEIFVGTTYNPTTNRLGKPLSQRAKILDATGYDMMLPTSDSFVPSSLSALSTEIDYNGILIHKNYDNEWCYVIITDALIYYNGDSDFAVVVANASVANSTIVDDEVVYQLTVMQNGDNNATRLNVSLDAEIFVNGISYCYDGYCAQYLREGSVFFYKTDSYGLVNKIDIVLQGRYDYDTIKCTTTGASATPTAGVQVFMPAPTEIKPQNWFMNVDERACIGEDETIQLFIAPVMTVGSNYITFGAVEDNGGLYVNTNVDYTYSIADDANLYEYALDEAGMGANAFAGGTFQGFDITDADANGRAWMTNVPANENNLDGCIQFAFVMAVDGEITNALLFNA